MINSVQLLLFALPSILLGHEVLASTDALLERLRTDHAAMVSAEEDFHARRARGVLNGTEAADYASYVAGLHRRVAEDCVSLDNQGIPIPPGLSCPEDPAAIITPAAIDQASERTGKEATDTLDAELFSGLGEFDEMLLQEQERIKAATPRDVSTSGSGGGGAGSSSTPASAGGSTDSEASTGYGAGPGSTQATRESSAPPGTPDGSDDDVVARQLREAAENETDPELKKKLWEEYRKYKAGTS